VILDFISSLGTLSFSPDLVEGLVVLDWVICQVQETLFGDVIRIFVLEVLGSVDETRLILRLLLLKGLKVLNPSLHPLMNPLTPRGLKP
jgi:hypothetical protein